MKSAQEIGLAILERLRAQSAAKRAEGNLLRAEVRAAYADLRQIPGRLTAKQIIKKLTRAPLPSVRRVQEVLKEIRAESSVTR